MLSPHGARLRAEQLEHRVMLAANSLHTDHPTIDISQLEFREIDGTGNNLVEDEQGAAITRVIRFGYPGVYPDGHGDEIDVPGRPNARDISNEIQAQTESVLNDRRLTDWVFQWGQFLTHDMDLTINGPEFNLLSTGEVGDFTIAINDENDPLGPNPIPFNRSEFDPATGTPDLIDTGFGPRPNWREQINRVTSYIDASNVYGSDDERAKALRTFHDGKLITTADGLLPALNDAGLANDDPLGLGDELFLAGDVRANETVALTAVHSLFVREHNRLADRIKDLYPDLQDEEIYQLARRIVGAEIQAITYNEFLPAVLGYESAPKAADAAYSAGVNASITNSFATAILRFGHSLINEVLLLVDDSGDTVGTLSLDEAFFDPDFLKSNPQNVDLLMKGLAEQLGQENDLLLVDGVRNNLFGQPGSGGSDLAALDIQRGRDHGLPDYNSLRDFYGLERVTSFDEISSDSEIQAKLEELYGSVDNIDAFVGALAEDHLHGSSVGPLVDAILVNQFTRLRDGDRFYYAHDPLLSSYYVKRIIDVDDVTLSKIIRWNTSITNIQDNVFYDPSVLFFEVPDGSHTSVTSLFASSDHVVVWNKQAGGLVEYAPTEDVSQVILVGSETRNDSFIVSVGGAKGGLEDGVVVYGGGRFDLLTVNGTSRGDSIVVDAPYAHVNDATIEFGGFELLLLMPGRGRDHVSVVNEGNAQVYVVDPDRDHHHHHNDSDAQRHDGPGQAQLAVDNDRPTKRSTKSEPAPTDANLIVDTQSDDDEEDDEGDAEDSELLSVV